jgi:hypothetical protein
MSFRSVEISHLQHQNSLSKTKYRSIKSEYLFGRGLASFRFIRTTAYPSSFFNILEIDREKGHQFD